MLDTSVERATTAAQLTTTSWRRYSARLATHFLQWNVVSGALGLCDFAHDMLHWAKHAGNIYRKPCDVSEAAFRLRHYCHRIEKALLLRHREAQSTPSFVPAFLDDLGFWLDHPLAADPGLERMLSATLSHYRNAISGSFTAQPPEFQERLDEALLRLRSRNALHGGQGGDAGGTSTVTRADHVAAHFNRLVAHRHSARTFTDGEVPDTVLVECVSLAQRSPSACNRQAVRVHVYSDRRQVLNILRHQNGNHGFGDMVNKLVLLTYNSRALLSSSERNLPYLDTGLFAMTLLYALESQNVATCCLNLSKHWFRERGLRRACNIPGYERPILLIAVGRSPESYEVPVSARVPTADILQFHDAGGSAPPAPLNVA